MVAGGILLQRTLARRQEIGGESKRFECSERRADPTANRYAKRIAHMMRAYFPVKGGRASFPRRNSILPLHAIDGSQVERTTQITPLTLEAG